MSGKFGDKPARCRRPAEFIVTWARKHTPEPLHDATIRDMAAYYSVTDSSIRMWARLAVPPVPGGYPRGALQRARAARRKPKPKRKRVARTPPLPVPAFDPEAFLDRMRSAFIAELHQRRGKRLARIFHAEIRI